MATNGDASMAKRRIGGMDLTKKIDDADFYSERVRRERAFQWHARWAMPNYDRMIENVRKSKGLDITEADVDLLPWDKNRRLNRNEYNALQNGTSTRQNEGPIKDFLDQDKVRQAKKERELEEEEEEQRLREERAAQRRAAADARLKELEEQKREREEAEKFRREEAERLRREAEEAERLRKEEKALRKLPPVPTDGDTPVERAYRWFHKLKNPTRDQMKAAIEKTSGMDITAADVDALPWKKDGMAISYPKLHDLLEAATGQKPDVITDEQDHHINISPPRPASVKDIEQVKEILEAFEWYKELEDPKLATYSAIKDKTNGVVPSQQAIKDLPWDPEQQYVDPNKMKLWQHRLEELEEKDRRRAQEAERKRREKPPVVTDGDTPLEKAYRWFHTLKQPTREQMKAAIQKTTGMDISARDVDRLPWNPDGKSLNYPKLHDMLEALLGHKVDTMPEPVKELVNISAPEPADVSDINQIKEIVEAFDWYQNLEDPKLATYSAIKEETDGVAPTQEAIESLPWDPTQMYVDPEKMKEWMDRLAGLEEEERLRRAMPPVVTDGDTPLEKAYQWFHKLKQPTREQMKAAIQNTSGMDISERDVDKLPWKPDGESIDYPKLHDKLEEILGRKVESMENEPTNKLVNISPPRPADVSDMEQVKEILEAFDWYQNLDDPKLATYSAVKVETEGVVPTQEAINNLPWDPSQKYVDPNKMQEWRDRLAELEEAEQRRIAEEEARRQKPPVITDGDAPVERAYRWYCQLKQPTRDQMKAAIQNTSGMDISEQDVDELPWNPDGQSLDYPKLHDKLEKILGRKVESMEEPTNKLANIAPPHPADVSDMEQIKEILEAFDWYQTLEDPKLATYSAVKTETQGVVPTQKAIKSLPWDRTQMYVDPNKMQEWKDRLAELEEEERRRLAEEERLRRLEEERRQKPPAVTNGNTPVEKAYRWYHKLKQPTREQMKAAIRNTTGMDIDERDVDELPWNPDGKSLNYPRLHDKLEAILGRKAATMDEPTNKLVNISPPRPADVNDIGKIQEILEAFEWYQDLEDPKLATYSAVKKETDGVIPTQNAIESLPWDPSQMYVDPKKMRAWKDRLAQLEEEERRRAAEAERKRQEELRRLEEERRRLEEERRRAEEEERRRAEEEERKRRKEELERQSREPPPIPHGNSPIERAYRTYDMLAHPTKATMDAATEKTEGLEITEDEVDVLPWKKGGKEIDFAKVREMIDREKRRRQMEKKIIDMWKKLDKPNKEQMKQMCLELECGITDDDISLLTWDEKDENIIERDYDEDEKAAARRRAFERKRIEEEERLARKREIEIKKKEYPKKAARPPPIPIGNEPIERAYRWYSRLSGPDRAELKRVCVKDKLDISEADVDLLPWIKKGAILDFARLKELLDIEEEKRKAKLYGRKPKPLPESSEKSDAEKRKERAYKWYKLLKKPKQATMYRLVDETIGMEELAYHDVDLLPWDEECIYVKEDLM